MLFLSGEPSCGSKPNCSLKMLTRSVASITRIARMSNGPPMRWFGWFKRSASAGETKQIEPPHWACLGRNPCPGLMEGTTSRRKEPSCASICCDSYQQKLRTSMFSSRPSQRLLRSSSRRGPDRSMGVEPGEPFSCDRNISSMLSATA
jgi:hypothetical protein